MSFESGSISFRIYRLPRKLPDDAVDRFSHHAAVPHDSLKEGESAGWVTGRHLLDRNITEESALYGGFLRLNLRLAEKKVPASLLKAECTMEEMAVMAAEGKPFVDRKQRSEIKKMVQERLLPQMPASLKGIPVVCHPADTLLYAGALSVKQSDLLVTRFVQAVGYQMMPLTPESAAQDCKQSDPRDWMPCSFTDRLPDEAIEPGPGRDFLTWLWFCSEQGDGTVSIGDHQVGLLIEGPLTFIHEGGGAHETVLKKGSPSTSTEAGTCLQSGKKLRKARISFVLGEAVWRFSLDADEFTFSSLVLPDPEDGLDAISRFQDRMMTLNQFQEMFYGLYGSFVEKRQSPPSWKPVKDAMKKWVASRKGTM